MSADEIPASGSVEVHVLNNGYVGLYGDDERVSGTVTLIIDSGAVIVVDPDHHPDHTVNAALFPAARPEVDPLATDAAALTVSRDLPLSFATVIVPGHGTPFRPFRDVSPS